jgi:hypothetical protein
MKPLCIFLISLIVICILFSYSTKKLNSINNPNQYNIDNKKKYKLEINKNINTNNVNNFNFNFKQKQIDNNYNYNINPYNNILKKFESLNSNKKNTKKTIEKNTLLEKQILKRYQLQLENFRNLLYTSPKKINKCKDFSLFKSFYENKNPFNLSIFINDYDKEINSHFENFLLSAEDKIKLDIFRINIFNEENSNENLNINNKNLFDNYNNNNNNTYNTNENKINIIKPLIRNKNIDQKKTNKIFTNKNFGKFGIEDNFSILTNRKIEININDYNNNNSSINNNNNTINNNFTFNYNNNNNNSPNTNKILKFNLVDFGNNKEENYLKIIDKEEILYFRAKNFYLSFSPKPIFEEELHIENELKYISYPMQLIFLYESIANKDNKNIKNLLLNINFNIRKKRSDFLNAEKAWKSKIKKKLFSITKKTNIDKKANNTDNTDTNINNTNNLNDFAFNSNKNNLNLNENLLSLLKEDLMMFISTGYNKDNNDINNNNNNYIDNLNSIKLDSTWNSNLSSLNITVIQLKKLIKDNYNLRDDSDIGNLFINSIMDLINTIINKENLLNKKDEKENEKDKNSTKEIEYNIGLDLSTINQKLKDPNSKFEISKIFLNENNNNKNNECELFFNIDLINEIEISYNYFKKLKKLLNKISLIGKINQKNLPIAIGKKNDNLTLTLKNNNNINRISNSFISNLIKKEKNLNKFYRYNNNNNDNNSNDNYTKFNSTNDKNNNFKSKLNTNLINNSSLTLTANSNLNLNSSSTNLALFTLSFSNNFFIEKIFEKKFKKIYLNNNDNGFSSFSSLSDYDYDNDNDIKNFKNFRIFPFSKIDDPTFKLENDIMDEDDLFMPINRLLNSRSKIPDTFKLIDKFSNIIKSSKDLIGGINVNYREEKGEFYKNKTPNNNNNNNNIRNKKKRLSRKHREILLKEKEAELKVNNNNNDNKDIKNKLNDFININLNKTNFNNTNIINDIKSKNSTCGCIKEKIKIKQNRIKENDNNNLIRRKNPRKKRHKNSNNNTFANISNNNITQIQTQPQIQDPIAIIPDKTNDNNGLVRKKRRNKNKNNTLTNTTLITTSTDPNLNKTKIKNKNKNKIKAKAKNNTKSKNLTNNAKKNSKNITNLNPNELNKISENFLKDPNITNNNNDNNNDDNINNNYNKTNNLPIVHLKSLEKYKELYDFLDTIKIIPLIKSNLNQEIIKNNTKLNEIPIIENKIDININIIKNNTEKSKKKIFIFIFLI